MTPTRFESNELQRCHTGCHELRLVFETTTGVRVCSHCGALMHSPPPTTHEQRIGNIQSRVEMLEAYVHQLLRRCPP